MSGRGDYSRGAQKDRKAQERRQRQAEKLARKVERRAIRKGEAKR